MFDRSYSIAKPAEEILAYLKAKQSGCHALRRRAVIYNSDGKWVLQACVVEGISVNGKTSVPETICFHKYGYLQYNSSPVQMASDLMTK